MRAGTEIAVVAILADDAARHARDAAHGWSETADRDALMSAVTTLVPAAAPLIGVAQDWKSWQLYETAPLACGCNGRIALLGDAAHPVLPFLAQGGVLALEDAVTLARHDQVRRPGRR